MFQLTNHIPHEKLQSFCRTNHITKLSLFGSALRDELTPESDVDLLVEFEEEYTPGLITFAGMEIELTEIIGRKVDLRTPAELSRFFRDEVVSQRKPTANGVFTRRELRTILRIDDFFPVHRQEVVNVL